MPDLQHLWQRFLLAAALIAGLAIGVGATVFGYSNLNTVDLHWSVLQLSGIPLWAVVIVPIAYVALSGFRTTGQLAFDPVGLPHPWVTHN